MRHELDLHPTQYPELCVGISERRADYGRVRIIGTPIHPEDLTEYLDIPPYTSKPVVRKRIRGAIVEAISAIESTYFEIYGTGCLTPAAVMNAFCHVRSAVEEGLCLTPTWRAASTNNNVIQFFERNTLPLLTPKLVSTQMFLKDDQRDLLADMTRICARHGSESELAAQENARKRLLEAEIVLSHMREFDPRISEYKLIPPEFNVRAHRSEQVKMLPLAVLTRFYGALSALAATEPKKVFFGIMVVFGCRPAEAAGTKPSDINWFDTFCSVRIVNQEVNGKLTTTLKNRYSARQIVIPFWGMRLLRVCCDRIGHDYPSDNEPMNSAIECAAWIKRLLINSGAGEAQLRDISGDISNEDLDDSSIYASRKAEETTRDKAEKIGCYVLRRCAATIMRVYMGLTLFEVDRLLGHIPHGSGRNKASKLANPDLNAPETQRQIAQKMERYVFDPTISLNPKNTPLTTAGKDVIHMALAYPEVAIVNNEEADIMLELDLTAVEAGEGLTLILPEPDCGNINYSSVPLSYEGLNRTIFVEGGEQECQRPQP